MLKKGSLLHTERPFVHTLSSKFRNSRCDNCYAEYELFKCGNCHSVKYCDRKCQKAAWTDHKGECSPLKTLQQAGRELPNAARQLTRIILKLKRGGGSQQGWYDKKRFRMFKDLMSHYSNMKNDQKRMEHAQCLYSVLGDFIGEDALPNFTEFVGIYGRMVVNSYNILDGEMNELGTGVYLGASTIDHSCDPNAIATFSGTTISIRAIKDIPDFKWSKVRISYIDTLKPRLERHEELARYYFECDCPKCDISSEWFLAENSLACSQCASAIFISQDVPSCSSCGWEPEKSLVMRYQDVLEFTKHHHLLMKDIAYLDACQLCLEKQKSLFHPHNVYSVRTLDLAFEASVQLQKWDDSLALGPELIPGYEKYYGSHHPILGLHYLKYGKILLLKDACEEAMDALEKAQAILRVTHGEDHHLYRSELSPLLLQAKSLLYHSTNGSV